jgi:hypothetical protein
VCWQRLESNVFVSVVFPLSFFELKTRQHNIELPFPRHVLTTLPFLGLGPCRCWPVQRIIERVQYLAWPSTGTQRGCCCRGC